GLQIIREAYRFESRVWKVRAHRELRRQWTRRIEAQLVGRRIRSPEGLELACAWIHANPLGLGDAQQIAFGLESHVEGPQDRGIVVHVDVLIHHDDMFEEMIDGKCCKKCLFAISVAEFGYRQV